MQQRLAEMRSACPVLRPEEAIAVTTPAPEENPTVIVTKELEVLLKLQKMHGQLTTFISLLTTQGETITNVQGEVSQLRDRVTTLEAIQSTQQGARQPWYVVLGAVVPSIALLLVVAQQLYQK
jgi:hypothetical protein